MRKKAIFILLATLCWINVFAANSLTFSEKVKDLGIIGQHKRFVWTVKVKNISQKPVSFKKIKTTCGCTYAKPEKKTILPGEEIKFKVIFNSEAFEGKIEKLVFIDTSTKERYVLKLKADVKKDIYIEPAKISVSTKDDYLEQLVEIKTFENNKKIKIAKIAPPKEKGIKIRKIDNKSFVVEITPSKFKKGGTRFVKIFIEGKNTPYSLPIEVKTPKKYSLFPSDTLLFLNTKMGTKTERVIEVSSKEKFNIISEKTGFPFLSIKSKEKISDNRWKITFLFDTEKLGNKKTGQDILKLKTDNKNAEFITIKIVYHITK